MLTMFSNDNCLHSMSFLSQQWQMTHGTRKALSCKAMMSSLQTTEISVFLCHWWWLNEYAMLFVWMSEYYKTAATVLFAATLSNAAVLLSVDEYLKLIHSNFFCPGEMVMAHSHFNVVTHFFAQYSTEPWSTAITTSAPTCTPLWVPQRVIKVPLAWVCKWSSTASLTEEVLSHKWRRNRTRDNCISGAVAATTGATKFWIPCCKGPDVVTRTAICHRQTWNIGPVQSGQTTMVVTVECRCSIVLVSTSSSTDLSVGDPVCWKCDIGAAIVARMWTSTHTCGWFNSVGQPLRTGIVHFSHINISCPHPSSSDVVTMVGLHFTMHSFHSLWCHNVVVSWRECRIALVQFFARRVDYCFTL